MRVPRKCTPKCYENRVLPALEKKHVSVTNCQHDVFFFKNFRLKMLDSDMFRAFVHVQVVQLTKFDYRVSNILETDLQKLRCRVNYHALKFTDPIHKMGQMLFQRMRAKSGRFIALHLR
jgi:hypothetical protein